MRTVMCFPELNMAMACGHLTRQPSPSGSPLFAQQLQMLHNKQLNNVDQLLLTTLYVLQLSPLLPLQQSTPAKPPPPVHAAEAASQAAATALLQEETQASQAAQQAKERKAAKKARQKQRKQVQHATLPSLRSDLAVQWLGRHRALVPCSWIC